MKPNTMNHDLIASLHKSYQSTSADESKHLGCSETLVGVKSIVDLSGHKRKTGGWTESSKLIVLKPVFEGD